MGHEGVSAAGGVRVAYPHKTPTGVPADRGDEIAAWLAEHDVGGYVIIDDHGNTGELRTRLVLAVADRSVSHTLAS